MQTAVAYFRVVDAVQSVVAIENVHVAVAQTALRTSAELGAFLAKETAAAGTVRPPVTARTTTPRVSALPAEDGNGLTHDPSGLVELGKF